jgi:long-chain acyl-CoA synthetase
MSDGSPSTEQGSATETIAGMVLAAAREHEGVALRYPDGDGWSTLSYPDLGERATAIARGLIALGVEPGDRVAIFGDTRVEWTLCDFGALCAGAVVASVYHTSSVQEARHVLEDSGAKVVFCEGAEQFGKVEEMREELDALEHVVLFEGAFADLGDEDEDEGENEDEDEGENEDEDEGESEDEGEDEDEGEGEHEDEGEGDEGKDDDGDDGEGEEGGAIGLDKLIRRGREVDEEQVRERVEALTGDDLFALIYTSGTTGSAKGCMLSHGNYRANCDMLVPALDPGEDPVFQIGLPLAHTFNRMIQMVAIRVGGELAFWSGDRDRLVEDLRELRPTHYPAVPRIFEKIYHQARAEVPDEGDKAKIFEKLLDRGRRVQDKRHEGKSPGPLLKVGHALAENELLAEVREMFGGRLRVALTGAAPMPRDVLDFFYACGVLLLEAYGLTETSTAVSANTPHDFRHGTVGKPLEGCEVRIDEEDGEILVRGPHVFQGYWNDEEATAEAFDDDGWLRTGDLGSIDDDGFLSVQGRKKDLIVTSSGENIPAAQIEERIAESRWLSNAVLYGDQKNYVVALVTIDEDQREALGEKTGTRDLDQAEMRRQMPENENVRNLIQREIDAANKEFARIEQVKRFAILDHDLSEDDDELTPTMKVKREVVHEHYRDIFEGLYEDEDG